MPLEWAPICSVTLTAAAIFLATVAADITIPPTKAVTVWLVCLSLLPCGAAFWLAVLGTRRRYLDTVLEPFALFAASATGVFLVILAYMVATTG